MQNEMPDFENFDSVWERVEKRSEPEKKPMPPVCILKPAEKSRATRFLPRF